MSDNIRTLRLNIPQWQGGNNPAYHFGAQLLAWLAPKNDDLVVDIPVEFDELGRLEIEDGIVGRSQIIRQQQFTQAAIAKHTPDRLVVLGGDCLVDLAPFAYLSEKYGDKLGVLWIDAHPDIMTPEQFSHSHAMVLRALMGEGDTQLASLTSRPIKPCQIFYAGLNEESEYEAKFIQQKGIRVCRPEALRQDCGAIEQWSAQEQIQCLAIHLDLDVLSTSAFGSLLFCNPNVPKNTFDGIPQGKLDLAEVLNIINTASEHAEVVGLGIAEHLPWDSLNLKKFLTKLPLLGKK